MANRKNDDDDSIAEANRAMVRDDDKNDIVENADVECQHCQLLDGVRRFGVRSIEMFLEGILQFGENLFFYPPFQGPAPRSRPKPTPPPPPTPPFQGPAPNRHHHHHHHHQRRQQHQPPRYDEYIENGRLLDEEGNRLHETCPEFELIGRALGEQIDDIREVFVVFVGRSARTVVVHEEVYIQIGLLLYKFGQNRERFRPLLEDYGRSLVLHGRKVDENHRRQLLLLEQQIVNGGLNFDELLLVSEQFANRRRREINRIALDDIDRQLVENRQAARVAYDFVNLVGIDLGGGAA